MGKSLTPVELELMQILWRLGGGTVRDVLDALPEGRKLAYTSVSTVLRILEQKDVVESVKEGRGHVYTPLFGKEEYEGHALNALVATVFDGQASSLIARLVDTVGLTKDDIARIESLLKGKP